MITGVVDKVKLKYKPAYDQYVKDYKAYLKLRGYGNHIHDIYFVRHGFIECWWAPGFHRFWQIWNPGIGYFTYKLYLLLGRIENRSLATIIVFFISGGIHNLIMLPFIRRFSFPLPFTFLSFGLFTVVFRELDRHIRLERLPRFLHLAINVGLVIMSFDFGFYMGRYLYVLLLK
jgi:hypothetical protein